MGRQEPWVLAETLSLLRPANRRTQPALGCGGSPGSTLLLFFIFIFLLLPLPWRRGLIAAQTFNSHGNCNNNMGRGPSACDIAAGGAEL